MSPAFMSRSMSLLRSRNARLSLSALLVALLLAAFLAAPHVAGASGSGYGTHERDGVGGGSSLPVPLGPQGLLEQFKVAEPADEAGKLLVFGSLFTSGGLYAPDAGYGLKPLSAVPQPRDDTLPAQLLRRPPPFPG